MGGILGDSWPCVGGRLPLYGAHADRGTGRIKRIRGNGAVGVLGHDVIAPNVIEVKWFTGKGSVGVVLIKTEYAGLKAYIGVGLDVNEDYDSEFIARYGVKLPRHIAAAYFPKRIKDGVQYDGKTDPRPKGRKDVG